MKLHAKIKSQFLDQILAGKKWCEYRQFETMTLTDENGRSVSFDVSFVDCLSFSADGAVRDAFPDIQWLGGKRIHRIALGEKVE